MVDLALCTLQHDAGDLGWGEGGGEGGGGEGGGLSTQRNYDTRSFTNMPFGQFSVRVRPTLM